MRNLNFKDYVVTVPAANPAVLLSDVKAWLKITSASEDALLNMLIESVTKQFESVTNVPLITRTYQAYLDTTDCRCHIYNYRSVVIRRANVSSIGSLEFLIDGTFTAVDSAIYKLTNQGRSAYPEITLLESKVWPTTLDFEKQSVRLTFDAGYGADDTSVPDDIKQALIMWVANLYSNRGDCGDGCGIIPSYVKGVIGNYKVFDLRVC